LVNLRLNSLSNSPVSTGLGVVIQARNIDRG
jgi:hypothetical protein